MGPQLLAMPHAAIRRTVEFIFFTLLPFYCTERTRHVCFMDDVYPGIRLDNEIVYSGIVLSYS